MCPQYFFFYTILLANCTNVNCIIFITDTFAVQNIVGPADSDCCIPIGDFREKPQSHSWHCSDSRGGLLIVVHVQGVVGFREQIQPRTRVEKFHNAVY